MKIRKLVLALLRGASARRKASPGAPLVLVQIHGGWVALMLILWLVWMQSP